jgi:hypothetical protein
MVAFANTVIGFHGTPTAFPVINWLVQDLSVDKALNVHLNL